MKETKMLEIVTATGADDSVDPSELVNLSRKFPFAEFGILLSAGEARPRFPSIGWLVELAKERAASNPHMKVSAHLCGKIVEEMYRGDWSWFNALKISLPATHTLPLFDRLQINTHGVLHALSYTKLRDSVVACIKSNVSPIFQYDGINDVVTQLARDLPQYPRRIHALFDLSHGEGRLPPGYPEPLPDIYCGYAGGLSPDNVAAEITKMARVAKSTPFWIDAETFLRSGSSFDLTLTEKFFKAASPYVPIY
jgi:hypothetical protein